MAPIDLNSIHRSLSTAMFLFSALSGGWGLWTYLRRRSVTASYWGILACLELLAVAQGLVGVTLLLSGVQPARFVHILYGLVAVVTLPGTYGFTRGRDDRQMALTYSLICLFLLGVALRAASTAGSLRP
jgi:hypothetical protein